MNGLFSLLGLAKRAGKLVPGITNCLHAVCTGQAKLVIITRDAGTTKKKVIKNCRVRQIPCVEFGMKEQFHRLLGQSSCFWVILSEDFACGFLEKYQVNGDNNLDRGD